MIRLFKHYIPHSVVLLALLDLLLLSVSGEAAWIVRAAQAGLDVGPFSERAVPLAAFSLSIFTAMVAVGIYSSDALLSLRFAIARLLVAISLAIITISVIGFLLPGATFWRSTLFFAMVLSFASIVLARIIVMSFSRGTSFRRRIVVLGAGKRAQKLLDLGERPEAGFVIASFIAMSAAENTVNGAINREDIGDLGEFVAECKAVEVVLALEERRNALPLKDLLRIKTKGVHVNESSGFLERETGRIDLESVNPSWLIFSDGFSSGRMLSTIFKRTFDIVVSLVLLIFTAPIIALFAILVKIDSKGPAFFYQKRVGLYGETFDVIKLRSMRTDAEKDGVKWAQENDPRVTRLGRFIRKVRIDELPQTWSVLKGEMSFVGPRPEVPKFVADLEEHLPYYNERHMVKPGITGWAQVNYPYGASIEDARHKLEYDLYYVKNYSPFLDILILLQTLRVVLWPEGAR